MNRLAFRVALLLALVAAGTATAQSNDFARFQEQEAIVLLANGEGYRGVLLVFTPQEVKLRAAQDGGRPVTWFARQIHVVKVGSELFVYNPKKETLEHNQALPGAVIPLEVSGMGLTPVEATRDALLNAVRQVVGTVIDGETLIKNDELIRDQVLAYSDGFVSDYEELDRHKEEGLWVVKVRARVERGKLVSKLQESNLSVRAFDGKALFARVVTEVEREKAARELVDKLLADFPGGLISAEKVGKEEILEQSATEVTLAYRVVLGVDPEKYQGFLDKTLPVLERLASQEGTCVIHGKPDNRALRPLLASFVGEEAAPTATAPEGCLRIIPRGAHEQWDWWGHGFDPSKHVVFVVNTEHNNTHDVLVWNWYHIPAVKVPSPEMRLRIRFVDRAGRDVKQETVDVGPCYPGFNLSRQPVASPKTNETTQATQIIFSPYLLAGAYYTPQVVLTRKVKLQVTDLPRVEQVLCRVEPRTTKPLTGPTGQPTASLQNNDNPGHDPAAQPVEEDPAPHVARAEEQRLKGAHEKALTECAAALRINARYAPACRCRALVHYAQGDLKATQTDCDRAIELDPHCATAYALRADVQRRQQDLEKALADSTRAVELDADNVLAHAVQGEVYRQRGDWDRALAACDRAVHLDPGNVLALAARAAASLGKGDLARALADANRVLELVPGQGLAAEVRAEVHRRRGELEEALADCEVALRQDSNNPRALTTRAAARQAKGDADGALADCDRALQLQPDNALARSIRAALYHARGDLDKALSDCDRATELAPEIASSYALRADIRRQRGDLDRALADCERALQRQTDSALAYRVRADVYRQKGDLDHALADCDRAIQLDPKNGFIHGVRADVRRLKGEFDRAIGDCTRAVELDSGSAFVYAVRGDAHRNKGEFDDAIADCSRALQADAKNVLALTARCAAYHGKGDYDRARTDATGVIELHAGSALVFAIRADTYRRQGDWDRALADDNEALRLDPNYGFAYVTRAETWRRKGDVARAIADADKAIQFSPTSAQAYFTRGDAYRQQGDLDRAIADLTEAIRLDPDNAQAYESRSQAYHRKGLRYWTKSRADHKEAVRLDPSLGKK